MGFCFLTYFLTEFGSSWTPLIRHDCTVGWALQINFSRTLGLCQNILKNISNCTWVIFLFIFRKPGISVAPSSSDYVTGMNCPSLLLQNSSKCSSWSDKPNSLQSTKLSIFWPNSYPPLYPYLPISLLIFPKNLCFVVKPHVEMF